MINFFRMKKNEWKVKAALYGAIAAILDSRKDISELLQKMYIALKDVPTDELQEVLVSKLIEHASSMAQSEF